MEEESEFKKLPIDERCIHKLWKARVNGYEEAHKLFQQIDDEKSPEWSKYVGLIKKFVTDSNAMGQEKGLEAALAFVENCGHAGKTVGEVMSGIVSKCIAAPKTKTRELAVSVTLMYIEIEKHEAVMEELIKGMDQKNPKIVSGCVSAATLALQEFGSKVIAIKPLVKKIPVLLSDRDKTVRDEGKAMVVEMYRWIGVALKPQIANLQPVQITELEEEFKKVAPNPKPARYLRSQQQRQQPKSSGDDVGCEEENMDEPDTVAEVDPYDLMDPVDILSKLPKDFYEKVEAKKWQERKEAMESLETLLKAPKLESGDYGDLVRALKKIIGKDSNVMVIALAGKCLAALALGLKKRFQMYSGACVPTVLEKFREKKVNVVTALREAIDAIYLSTTIEAIMEDVLEALNNKNPAVKAETAAFLSRAFCQCQPTAVNKKLLKAYTTTLLKTLNEPDPGVRDASAEALGAAMKLVGEKQIAPFLTEVDALKMGKIKECCDKTTILVKIQESKKERPNTAPPKQSAAPKAGSTTAKPVTRPASSSALKKKPAAATSSAPNAKVVKSNKPVEREMSMEEVEEKAANILPADCISGLADMNWKTRLATMENLVQTISTLDPAEVSAQVLVKIITKKPGLKDTNFQVLRMRLEAIKTIASSFPFSTISADNCLADVTDKLGDAKNGQVASEVLTAITEATNLEYVTNETLNFAFNQKNPKVQQEIFAWLANSIKEFGLSVNTKSLIDYIKKGLAVTSPGVRNNAIALIGVLYLYMGNNIVIHFESEKAGLKQQIDTEISKYKNERPPAPIKGAVSKSSSRNSILEEEDVDDNSQDSNTAPVRDTPNDTVTRVDISPLITEGLLNELADKNWKVRMEALTKISNIISEAKSISSNVGDLPAALAPRLVDSNSKLAQTAINVCENLASAMGSRCKQHVRTLFPGFLQSLGDSKTWIRSSAISCINTWGEQAGFKEFFDGEIIADALKTGSPTLRIELWQWLASKLPDIKPKSFPREEMMACLPYLYSNLEDRNADVRKNAQEAVLGVMMHLGYDSMLKQTEKLKNDTLYRSDPGSRTVVVAALDKARPGLPMKALPAVKPKIEEVKTVKSGGAAGRQSVLQKAVKPKAGAAKVAATTSRKKDEDVDTSPLLAINNLKHQRSLDEQKLKVLKWNFVTPREEFVELLRDQMTTANVNRTLMANMFHADFRYHLKALEALAEDLPDNIDALIANLDLILKWLTLRFFDTNPSVLLKGLEYLQNVFGILVDMKHGLSDSEASSFIPYLIIKVGDPKDAVRNGVRVLFNQIALIYPANKLFTYVIDGLKSKNARQRTECLEELGCLIEGYGMTVCQPSPTQALREIAKQISDRDNSVRNAALNCVVQAYRIEGEKIYRLIGQISDKDLSLLEERIKRAGKASKPTRMSVMPPSSNLISPNRNKRESTYVEPEPEPEPMMDEDDEDVIEEPQPLPPTPILEKPKPLSGPFGLDQNLIKEIENEPVQLIAPKLIEMDLDFLYEDAPSAPPEKLSVMSFSPPKRLIYDKNMWLSRNSNTSPSATTLNSPSNKTSPLAAISQESTLERTINDIASNDLTTAMRAIAHMSDILHSSKANLMSAYEEKFMHSVLQQFTSLSRMNNQHPDILKMYRSCLSILISYFDNKVGGRQITRETLGGMIEQLIGLLTSSQLSSVPDAENYNKVINTLCIRLIERSDHTLIICALIKLLHDCAPTNTPSPRFVELVMKCLWKVVKLIPSWSDELDYEAILSEMHIFCTHYPLSWWKQQANDTPGRTIKTVVHAMAKIKGTNLLKHMSHIPNATNSEIYTYILRVVKSLNLEDTKQLQQPQIPMLKKEPTARPLSRAVHNLLSDIFQKIGTKETAKEGLLLLYEFREQHPEADIEPFLKRSSQFFQEYIEKGLEDIAASKRKHESRIHAHKTAVENISGAGAGLGSNVDQNTPEVWLQRLRNLEALAANTTSSATISDENLNSSVKPSTDLESIRRRLAGYSNGN